MRNQDKSPPQIPQAPREHYVLTPVGINIKSGAEHEAEKRDAIKAAVEAERRRKPRRKSTKHLIETAKRAGLAVTGLNPDGSVATGPDKAEQGNGPDDGNEWDEVPSYGDH